jgi:hypothetical protein
MDWNDKWMIEAGSCFRFPAKALQMRFGGPGAKANDFKGDGAIETFLMGTINYALTAPAYFLQQLIVAKISQHLCRSRTVSLAWHRRWIGGICILVLEQTKAGL